MAPLRKPDAVEMILTKIVWEGCCDAHRLYVAKRQVLELFVANCRWKRLSLMISCREKVSYRIEQRRQSQLWGEAI